MPGHLCSDPPVDPPEILALMRFASALAFAYFALPMICVTRRISVRLAVESALSQFLDRRKARTRALPAPSQPSPRDTRRSTTWPDLQTWNGDPPILEHAATAEISISARLGSYPAFRLG